MIEKFNYVKKGYAPEEVNAYIEKIESVLASYKEKDAAIKNALISAQIAADNIIKTAEAEATDIRSKAVKYLENINGSVSCQKIMLRDFQEDYNALIDKYVHKFNENDILKVYSKVDALEDYINDLQMGKFHEEVMPNNFIEFDNRQIALDTEETPSTSDANDTNFQEDVILNG